MFFEFIKNNIFIQNLAGEFLARIHPSIEHNIEKIRMLKKAFFHCELEQVEGAYFEFGIYEGTSLYAAARIYEKLKSKINRNFYGFDSFDDGFKYYNDIDKHPFFKEGDFKSSYAKACKRFEKLKNVRLIKGYLENTIAGKNAGDFCNETSCAVVFIDCDLMSPAHIALEFVGPLLREGSIIILDDYWAYKGDPEKGTCGALNKFLKNRPSLKIRDYADYGYGGKSFVVHHI